VKGKKIIAIIAVFVSAGIILSVYSSFTGEESINLDMNRMHGSINTSLGSPIMGLKAAPITIVEFGDYQCPNCKAWFLNTKPNIIESFIDTGKVKLIFMDIAFLGKDSLPAAMATYCAEEQGKYWEYHSVLYTNQQGIDTGWADSANLKNFAFDLGLDMDLFVSCFDSGKFENRVQFNTNIANESGVKATPTFVILDSKGNQETVIGPQPFSVFKNIIESEF